MLEQLEQCTICPHNCKVDRLSGIPGRCKATDKIKIALVSLHQYEEPCISGTNGSGTVFFSNCNLNCIYCQNYEISQQGKGYFISIDELANIFLEQQANNAHNINLVTPTIYAYQIKEALKIAKNMGLNIPVIYNSSGYDKVETLRELDQVIDVYLPDFKYAEDELGKKYSKVNNYATVAHEAIKEMVRQKGAPKLNDKGHIISGVIIRHLILPNNVQNTKAVLKWIKDNVGQDVYISVMAQYFPTNIISDENFPELNRKITKEELNEVEEYIFDLDFENGFIQELGNHEEEYVPNFDGSNVL